MQPNSDYNNVAVHRIQVFTYVVRAKAMAVVVSMSCGRCAFARAFSGKRLCVGVQRLLCRGHAWLVSA